MVLQGGEALEGLQERMFAVHSHDITRVKGMKSVPSRRNYTHACTNTTHTHIRAHARTTRSKRPHSHTHMTAHTWNTALMSSFIISTYVSYTFSVLRIWPEAYT